MPSWLDRWPQWLGGSAPPASPTEAPAEAAFGDELDLDRLNSDLVREYTRSLYLWRCVDLIATMSASVPLVVAKEHEESQLRPDETQVGKLLDYPNPQWTGKAMQYFIAASMAVANKAFVLIVRGNGRLPLELWPIAPNEVQINYSLESRMIEAFTITTGTQTTRYPVDPRTGESDVIHIRRPALNAASDKSPAAVAAAPAEVFTKILQRCADIVSNSSNITGMLSTDAELSEDSVKKVKDTISGFKTGRHQSGATLVTAQAKWTLTRLSEDPSTALSVEIKDSIARDVVMTFGCPTQLFGLPGTDTYNNIALARVGLVTDTVIPGYIEPYVAALNHSFMRNGARIRADTEHIPAMMQARSELVAIANAALCLSLNEQRALLGYGPDDDEMARKPVRIMEWKLKQAAIEAQGGNVENVLAGSPT